MTEKDAIEELDAPTGDDPELEHSAADGILYRFLMDQGYKDLAKAYEDAENRVGFWYA